MQPDTRDIQDAMSSALHASQRQQMAELGDDSGDGTRRDETSALLAQPPQLTPLPSRLDIAAQNTTASAHNAQLPQLRTNATALRIDSGLQDEEHTTASAEQYPRQPQIPTGPENDSHALPTDTSFVLTQSTPPYAAQPAAPSSDPTSAGSAASDQRQPHYRQAWSTVSMANSLSPSGGSTVSSPALNAMSDLTPLPSPLMVSSGSPPAAWRRSRTSRPGSGGDGTPLSPDQALAQGAISPTKRKQYGALLGGSGAPASILVQRNGRQHSRNRSLSEYKPDALHNVRPRHVTLSEESSQSSSLQSSEAPSSSNTSAMLREHYLAEERGHTGAGLPKSNAHQQQQQQQTQIGLPTPPPSDKSNNSLDSNMSLDSDDSYARDDVLRDRDVAILTVHQPGGKRQKMYRPVRLLGQGTFSKVVLATSDRKHFSGVASPEETSVNPKTLVAIKIVEHGPAGGADEERVELGLHREVETLLTLSHPSLVRIRTFDLDVSPALLVLDYCAGGDLFDLATGAREPLKLPVVRRIYAELVDAVSYLHSQWIVHRDVKLENVLVNVESSILLSPTPDFLASLSTHPHPLITLTDLGLCKQIPKPPESPMLTTRCGSEDYAAPEILLGQPYDGRATDAWALGVLLYALMERRLPFDPPPGHKGRKGRPAHRIARCEWVWCRFGDEDGEWDDSVNVGEGAKAAEWSQARQVVEGLLKKVSRGRASVDDVKAMPWVSDAIHVTGGIERAPDDEYDEGRDLKPVRPYQFKRTDTATVLAKYARAEEQEEEEREVMI